MESINALVVGCGAVGTMCAFALHKSQVPMVTAVFRSNFELVARRGLYIKSVDHGIIDGWKPHNVERTVADAIKHGPFDFVVVAMKNLPDMYSIPEIIKPAITLNRTAIVLIQNGIGVEQPFIDSFPENTLLSGVTMIGSELNGREILHNDPDKLHLAPFVNPSLPLEKQQDSCREFARIYELGGAKCAVHKDIVWHRWRKLVWNASFNPVCALVDLDSGTVQDAGCLDILIRPAMNEVVAIAKAAGYDLPSGIQDQMVALTPKETYLQPSMQVDAQKERPMEIEVILGNPLRVARDLLVPAPTLTTLYSLLLARQWACNNNTGA